MATVNAGFQIVATWPLRTERIRGLKTEVNALASSIVLVCRPRREDAPAIVRDDFLQKIEKGNAFRA